jgi:NAD(P)-dependent dehydrogenase (short-subunit alcohol dehydrogenase family)
MAEKKVVLVTGGNKGIGFEICRQLGRYGMKVILTARKEQSGLEAVSKLKSAGYDVTFVQLDVLDEKSIAGAAENVDKNIGRLDILINNAGIHLKPDRSGLDPDIDEIRRTMDTNVYGPLWVCHAFVPIMRRSKGGQIINITSRKGALHGMGGGEPGYRISKAALNAVTRILAAELAGTGILVNCVSPGHVRTDLGGPDAPQSVEEGADTVIWVATTNTEKTGRFFRERGEFGW